MGQLRIKRVAGVIKNELSILINQKLRDPRLKMVTITEVRLNKDMSIATVFFTALKENTEKNEVRDVLNNAAPFLRSQLVPALRIRKVPELKFEPDNSFEYGRKIDTLLDEIHKKSDAHENEQE